MSEQGKWNDELQTDLNDVTYSFNNRVGKLFMPEGCCCDMSGCINLFRRIDPKVQFIETWAGETLDTCYRKLHDGCWASRVPPEQTFFDACRIPDDRIATAHSPPQRI
jgi:hypothetical protein